MEICLLSKCCMKGKTDLKEPISGLQKAGWCKQPIVGSFLLSGDTIPFKLNECCNLLTIRHT